MEIKVKKAVGTPERTTTTLSITEGLQIPDKAKTKLKRDIGDFLVESVLKSVNSAESPVKGEGWEKLSTKYRKKKIAEGGTGKADMQLEGDMLDELDYTLTPDGIELGFVGGQAWKADGHLKFSGKENGTPKRRFLPGEGQEFDGDIQNEIQAMVAESVADNAPLKESDLDDVTTKAELYDLLSDLFEGWGRADIKAAVMRTDALRTLLEDAGVINLL